MIPSARCTLVALLITALERPAGDDGFLLHLWLATCVEHVGRRMDGRQVAHPHLTTKDDCRALGLATTSPQSPI